MRSSDIPETWLHRTDPKESVIVVGDVHGWPDRLATLLAAAETTAPFVVSVGDLNDRGPDSAAVIAMMRGLCVRGQAAMVMGNHEYAFCRAMGALPWQVGEGGDFQPDLAFAEAWMHVPWGGRETLLSYGVESIHEALEHSRQACDDVRWLAQLPWWLEVPLVGEKQNPMAGENPIAKEGIISTVHITHVGLPSAPLEQCFTWFQAQYARAFFGEKNVVYDLPEALFVKNMTTTMPTDLNDADYVVSGHVPQQRILPTNSNRRWVVDGSGGRANRYLSGVLLPEQQIFTG